MNNGGPSETKVGGDSGGNGNSVPSNGYGNSGSNSPPSGDNASQIPKYAYETLDHIKSHNGSPPEGYKGGGTFANDGRGGSARLPDCYSPYREYDVHPKIIGQSRGSERIVVGMGVAFYTPNHYMTFLIME